MKREQMLDFIRRGLVHEGRLTPFLEGRLEQAKTAYLTPFLEITYAEWKNAYPNL